MGLGTSNEQHDKGNIGSNSAPKYDSVTIIAQVASAGQEWSMAYMRICFMAFWRYPVRTQLTYFDISRYFVVDFKVSIHFLKYSY